MIYIFFKVKNNRDFNMSLIYKHDIMKIMEFVSCF